MLYLKTLCVARSKIVQALGLAYAIPVSYIITQNIVYYCI